MGNYWDTPVRHPEDTGVQYIRRTVDLALLTNPAYATNGVPIGALEPGTSPGHADVYIETAFNAGTTNVLIVGATDDDDGFATSAAVIAGTAGWKGALSGALTGIPLASAKVVYAKFSQTGTAATTGKAVITLTLRPKREGEGVAFPGN